MTKAKELKEHYTEIIFEPRTINELIPFWWIKDRKHLDGTREKILFLIFGD